MLIIFFFAELKMVTVQVPAAYGYCVLVAVFSIFVLIWKGVKVNILPDYCIIIVDNNEFLHITECIRICT